MKLFAAYTHNILDGEMDIHRTYMKRLGITQEEAETTPVSLDNRSYTSYMLRAAYEGGEAEVMAAILSCALSYEAIAKELVQHNPNAKDHPFYGEWVSGYASDSYHEENETLICLMDRLAAECTPAQMDHLIDIFILPLLKSETLAPVASTAFVMASADSLILTVRLTSGWIKARAFCASSSSA